MTYEEDLIEKAKLCTVDPAFITGFKQHLMEIGLWEKMGGPAPVVKKESAPIGAPAMHNITAVRAALFDNWPAGLFVKGTPNRYGLTLEIWTLPAEEIEAVKLNSMNFAFKTNMSLMDRKALRAQVKHLRKPRINSLSNVDADYLDALLTISDANPDLLVGLLNTTVRSDDSHYHRGVYYHPWQFMLIKMQDGAVLEAKVITSLDDGFLDLAPFVDTDWSGEKLGGKVIAQSRLDLVGMGHGWQS